MKKDFFDISFFLDSSEVAVICKLFPHKLFDSYQNLISSAKLEQLSQGEILSTSIEYKNDAFFTLEALKEDSFHLKKYLENRIEGHLEFRKILYSYENNKNTANDLLGALSLAEKSALRIEEYMPSFLRLIRSRFLVKSCTIFLVTERGKISPWIGVGDDGQDLKKEKISFCDISCAALVSNVKKIFISNCPAENKTYLSCNPDMAEIPSNFIYIPLMKNGEVFAVLELKNYLAGNVGDKELSVIQNLSRVLCQIFIEHFSNMQIKHLEKTSTGLEKYLSANVVAQIKKNEVNTKEISGVEKEVVVLFAKINNFSEISKRVSASVLIDLLNFHYEFMAKVINAHNGTIDKIIGNVIMAIWNHPIEQKNAFELALNAAIEMQRISSSHVVPVYKERGILNYGIGIGINKGKAVAGNLGAQQFMDFTVIGDTINLAQRLESKAESGEIWIKKEVLSSERDLRVKPNKMVSDVKIKGKDKPIDVFVYTPLAS